MQNVTLNNGVQMPILGFGVFQIPDGRDRAGRRRRPRGRLPATRHRRLLRQRGGRRPRDRRQRHPARGAVRHHQAVDPARPGERRRRQARVRALAAAARPGLPRPVPDPPAARRLLQRVAGDGGAPRARAWPGDRRVQLPPRPARRPHRPQRDHPGRQPDRDPPVLPARRRPGAHARTRRPDRVLGPVRRGQEQPVHRPGPQPRSARRTASPSPRSCCAGSSSATSSSSPSPSAPSGWPRTSTSSTSTLTDDEMSPHRRPGHRRQPVLRPPRPRHGQLARRPPDRLTRSERWPPTATALRRPRGPGRQLLRLVLTPHRVGGARCARPSAVWAPP